MSIQRLHPQPSVSRKVGIFRLQLFKPSETFIYEQAGRLARYSPVYIGSRSFGDPGNRTVRGSAAKPDASSLRALSTALLPRARPFLPGLAQDRLSLIHCHFGVDGVYAVPLAQRLGIPLVTTLHGFDVTRTDLDCLRSGRPALVNGVLFRKRLAARGSMFLCVSEFIRQSALARGYPPDKLRVHYIGIDCERIAPRQGPGQPGMIVHVARLVEKKGTTYLLRAVAKLAPEFEDLRLVVIGDGPRRADLEAQAAALGIAGRCRFVGTLPNHEVMAWIRQAAVKVVPSITAADGDMEGFGIVNLEASAQGVPVVASESGGIGEAIVNEQTGLLCPERDVEALSASIRKLLLNPDLRTEMGLRGRTRVEQSFNIARQTGTLESIYDEAIDAARVSRIA